LFFFVCFVCLFCLFCLFVLFVCLFVFMSSEFLLVAVQSD
jgi:hypothetical protein